MKNVLTTLVSLSFLAIATPAAAECGRVYLRGFSMIDRDSNGSFSSAETAEAKSNVDWFGNNPSQWDSFGKYFSSYFLQWDFDRNGKLDKTDQTIYNKVVARQTGCTTAQLITHSQVDGFGGNKDGDVGPLDLLNGYRKVLDAVRFYMDMAQ